VPARPGEISVVGRVEAALRTAVEAVRVALHVIQGEAVRQRAMALTYISLFALVPALVVAFSVLQAFTGLDKISDRVHEFLFANLAVGARATIEPYLDRFIRNAHATSAGLVGGALLVWSAVSLFQNVERAVNDIWGIRRRRSIAQQAIIYWVGVTLGPLLLAGSITLGHTAETILVGWGAKFLVVVTGTLLTCALFGTAYLIVPNTRVQVRSAALGGLVAGIAWELAKWGYTFAVGRFFRYHAVYGSVAAVPIFLFWLFVSWTLLLFGARLAYVFQYRGTIVARGPRGDTAAGREVIAGQAMLAVARAFDAGEPALDAGDLATRIGASAEETGEAVAALRQRGVLVALADGGLVPARPLEKITLLDVRRAVAGREPTLGTTPGLLPGILNDVDSRAAEELDGVTFRQLCDQERGTGAVRQERPSVGTSTGLQPAPAAPDRA
jgi:membrane protein